MRGFMGYFASKSGFFVHIKVVLCCEDDSV